MAPAGPAVVVTPNISAVAQSLAQITPIDDVYVVLVAGGSASGKSLVAQLIMETLKGKSVRCIEQDNFYREISRDENNEKRALIKEGKYNFDHPSAIDHELLLDTVRKLKSRQRVEIPQYDFATSSRKEEVTVIEPADVIVVEGILALYWAEIRQLANLKIFVATDSDVRLARRVQRDIEVRGRAVSSVITQYLRFVKDSHDFFVEPSQAFADVVLPNRGEMSGLQVGLQVIIRHLHAELDLRSRPASPCDSEEALE